jgi:predicted MFS family arabinose efflux permease
MPEQRTTAPFGLTVFVMTVGGLLVVGQMYAVIPLLPAMAADWATTPAAATWTTTAFGLAYAGGFLISGPLSDRFGRRRIVVAGLVPLAVATCAVAFVPNLPSGLVLRVVQGIGAAGFSPAALAYLSERIEPRRRPTALTYLVTAMVAAAVVGQLGAQAAASAFGWRGVFVAGGVAVVALVVALWFVMLPDTTTSSATVRDSFAAMGRLVTRPTLALIYVAALSVLGAFVAVYTAFQLLGPATLTHHPQAMLLLRASALPALVAVPLLAPVLNRIRATVRAAVAMVLAAVVLAVLTVTTDSVVLIGVLLLVFVGALTAVSPGLTELVGTLSGAARGAGVAVYTFALLIGASVGPQVVTATRSGGLPTVLWVVSGALVVGVLLLLAADRLTGRRSADEIQRDPSVGARRTVSSGASS